MTRLFLVATAQKEAVQAAARAFGAQAHVRAFTRSDLERLKTPMLMVFDADRISELDPETLQLLRRTSRGGLRYSPAVVLCARKADIPAWRAAGAVAIAQNADRGAIKKAIQTALEGARTWVTSASYVGPCRRSHKAVLKWRNRRSADADAAAAKVREKAKRAGVVERVLSLDVIVRRLSLSATLLSGATIENRRAFRDLVGELQVSAQTQGRGDLARIIAGLRREAEEFVQHSQRDTSVVERLLEDLRNAL